jgi:hypothetical protein
VIRHLVATIVVVLVSLPLSVVLTLTMMPAWRWIEERYGIESIGHSGPADWCFMIVFAVCTLATGGVYVAGLRGVRRDTSAEGTAPRQSRSRYQK